MQKWTLALTVVNLLLLACNLSARNAVTADEIAPVLRARSFELVDSQGKTRAQLVVYPASKGPDGEPTADTTLLRLIGADGHPGVKLSADGNNAGLLLAGNSDAGEGWKGVQILSQDQGGKINLVDAEGKSQQLKP